MLCRNGLSVRTAIELFKKGFIGACAGADSAAGFEEITTGTIVLADFWVSSLFSTGKVSETYGLKPKTILVAPDGFWIYVLSSPSFSFSTGGFFSI